MKHLLLAVTGMSPQVITETLYAMHQQGQHVDELKVITTSRGQKEIWLNLMVGAPGCPGVLQQLINDYDLPAVKFNQDSIYVISDAQGNPLSDARTEEEHDAMADYITKVIQQETANRDQVIHASLAGGRKTMTFFMGYAMSLFGRPGDTLSHVLVEEAFESSNFFYPTPYSKAIKTRTGRTEDAKDARVSLANIPFVRMRDEIPAHLLDGKLDYTEAVNILNIAHEDHPLIIDLIDNKVCIAHLEAKLSPNDLAFYIWFIKQQAKTPEGVERPRANTVNAQYADSFLDEYMNLNSPKDGLLGAIIDPEADLELQKKHRAAFERGSEGYGMTMNYFSEKRTNVNKSLRAAFGKQLAEQIGIMNEKRGPYSLAIPLERVVLKGIDGEQTVV
ncbi:CRISPR-associated ring nuclease Csm6 [Pseudoalteromonas rubra]|uniref:CRISPR-associated ring nuclease Csm6 n=1 Tax=Pseudoalteromonas rubra TaxID=43658 RepID=UPI00069851E8|nr:CRISPR-associated ring nuclease Csm6 [Pseudoalteromonas rubra]